MGASLPFWFEIFAMAIAAAFIGAVVFWAVSVYVSFPLAVVVTVALVMGLRVISVQRRWKAPEWRQRRTDADRTAADSTGSNGTAS